jgi:chromosome segregation ATPase
MNETLTGTEPSKKGRFAIPILFGIVLALVAFSAVTFVRLDSLKQDVATMKGSIVTEIEKVNETAILSSSSNKQSLEALSQELDQTRRQASSAVGQARKDALNHAEQLARQLKVEQAEQQAQVASQLTEVKEAASATDSKISEVSTDVGNVRTEVGSTKSELEKTISELKSMRGDLGVQSGLIATNSKELTALRALGERDYYEFQIAKSKQPKKVGNVQLQLTKVDPQRNKYSLQLTADDKRVEKKDKTTNEPVQFYIAGTRQPLEIVVNEVTKDHVSGYVSVPRIMQARN